MQSLLVLEHVCVEVGVDVGLVLAQVIVPRAEIELLRLILVASCLVGTHLPRAGLPRKTLGPAQPAHAPTD